MLGFAVSSTMELISASHYVVSGIATPMLAQYQIRVHVEQILVQMGGGAGRLSMISPSALCHPGLCILMPVRTYTTQASGE
jgi:hypothetical protein